MNPLLDSDGWPKRPPHKCPDCPPETNPLRAKVVIPKWKGVQPDPERLRAAAPEMYWALKNALQALPAHRYLKTRRRILVALALVKSKEAIP